MGGPSSTSAGMGLRAGVGSAPCRVDPPPTIQFSPLRVSSVPEQSLKAVAAPFSTGALVMAFYHSNIKVANMPRLVPYLLCRQD